MKAILCDNLFPLIALTLILALLSALLGAEIRRLRYMIQYAIDAPDDPQAIKSILTDTLNGCTGADKGGAS